MAAENQFYLSGWKEAQMQEWLGEGESLSRTDLVPIPIGVIDKDARPMIRSELSMKVTRAADYAVRVMIHLATLPEGERALLPDLSLATGVPISFLSKVLQSLCRAKLVVSRRGQAGGFEILSAGRKASMKKVIEAIDGPICLNVCLMTGASCKRKSHCPAHPVWIKAQKAMIEVLDASTIAALAGKSGRV